MAVVDVTSKTQRIIVSASSEVRIIIPGTGFQSVKALPNTPVSVIVQGLLLQSIKVEPNDSIRVVNVGPRGFTGDQGPIGLTGPTNLFIQEDAPVTDELVYQWWETDSSGDLVTLWVYA